MKTKVLLIFISLAMFVGPALGGCAAGKYLNGGSCVNCPVNTWKTDTGNGPCNSCPANSTPSGATAGQIYAYNTCNCNNGYYGLSSSSDTTCTICPMNTYKSGTLNGPSSLCITCPSGSSTSIQYPGMSKYDCVALTGFVSDDDSNTFVCTSGYQPSGNTCLKCPVGKYKTAHGNDPCTSCPANSVSSGSVGSIYANGACNCITGYYGLWASTVTSCYICPVNTYKNMSWNTNTCSTCAYGTTTNSLVGQASCSVLPGFAWDVSANAYSCDVGYYNNSQTCVQCPNGTFKSSIGNTTCTLCPGNASSANVMGSQYAKNACTCNAGYYGLAVNSSVSCTACPSNSFKSASGNGDVYTCAPCPASTVGANSSSGAIYANQACSCPPGTFGLVASSSNSCSLCPVDSFKNITSTGDLSTCTLCASGSTTNGVSGANDSSNCVPKDGFTQVGPSSFVCSPGYGISGLNCLACPSGTYKSTAANATCSNCPSNSNAKSAVGAVFAPDACYCKPGYYGLGSSSSTSCAPCPIGTFNSAGNVASCSACPLHSTSNGIGAGSSPSAACLCNTGYYGLSNSSDIQCNSCPVNTYKNATGNGDVSLCNNCPGGSSTNGSTAQSSLTNCIPSNGFASDGNGGFSCDAGHFLSGSTSCLPCPANSYKSTVGNASCTTCPANSVSSNAIGAIFAQDACICYAGYYGLDTLSSVSCTVCPANTYKSQTANGNIDSACTTCPYGSSTNGASGSVSSNSCSALPGFVNSGSNLFVCAQGFAQVDSNCVKCAPGTYKSIIGNYSCSNCPNYSSSAQTSGAIYPPEACTCDAGYYGLVRIQSNSTCTACSENTYKPSAGNDDISSCVSCSIGMTSGTGATSCQYKQGYTSDGSGQTVCDAGYGFDNSSNSCFKCANSTFKFEIGNTECLPCPVGSSMTNISYPSSFVSACSCDPGFYGLLDTNCSRCVSCPLNTYKPSSGNGAISVCTSCPTNFVSSNTGSVSCVCAAGSALQENEECVLCPADFFKEEGNSTSCIPCPFGTTTNSVTGATSQNFCKILAQYASNTDGNLVCNVGYGFNSTLGNCLKCNQNFFKSNLGNTTCIPCQAGYSTDGMFGSSACVLVTDSNASLSYSNMSSSGTSAAVIGSVAGAVGLLAAALFVGLFIVARRKKSQEKSSEKGADLESKDRYTGRIKTNAQFKTLNNIQSLTPISSILGSSLSLSVPQLNIVRGTRTLTIVPNHTSAIVAFPAFMEIDSSLIRKTKKIAEGGFASIYFVDIIKKELSSQNGDQKVAKVVTDSASLLSMNADGQTIDASAGIKLAKMEAEFENEVSIMYTLQSCPNIARLLGFCKTTELSIIMKYYPESLARALHSKDSQLMPEMLEEAANSYALIAASLISDMQRGIADMHRIEVAHLDIKPQNILLERLTPEVARAQSQCRFFPFRAVFTDFGLARLVTNNEAVKGRRIAVANGLSLNYCSPESFNVVRMLENGIAVPCSTFYAMDVYSLTCTFYEVLTRNIPFYKQTAQVIETALRKNERPPLELPESMQSEEDHVKLFKKFKPLIESGWAPSFALRPSMHELGESITEILEDLDYI